MPLSPYTLHLGPLDYLCPLDAVTKSLGDAVDTVGAAVTAAERRPRTVKLKLPVEGNPRAAADPKAAGERLERQTRQLLENRRWLSHGLFLHWEVGDHLAAWVMLAGGDLTEQDPGVSFGMWTLDLGDVYVVGAPGTHRPGRRLDLADRRSPTVPRDTRGLLYTDDFATATLPTHPLILPGPIKTIRSSARTVRDIIPSTIRGGAIPDNAWIWRAAAAIDGEVITYLPDRFGTDVDSARAPRFLDDFGVVKAWDQNAPDNTSLGVSFTGAPLATAAGQDYQPDVAYGWERLYGQPSHPDRYIALENGNVRVRWLGQSTSTQGLLFEWWDEDYPGGARYRPEGRFGALPWNGDVGNNGNTDALEVTLVELTPERGVLEVRRGDWAFRAILQRGWTGIRLEAYADLVDPAEGLAFIEWQPTNMNGDGAATTAPAAAPFDFVKVVTAHRDAPDSTRAIAVAPAASTYDYGDALGVLLGDVTGTGLSITQQADAVATAGAPNLVAIQVGAPFPAFSGGDTEANLSTPAAIGALSLVDARSVPVLVAR